MPTKQTYGQAIGSGVQNVSGILSKLLQMAQQASPMDAGANVGYGATKGALNTDVGQNPMQNIMSEVAKKTLTKRMTSFAEKTPDTDLAKFLG